MRRSIPPSWRLALLLLAGWVCAWIFTGGPEALVAGAAGGTNRQTQGVLQSLALLALALSLVFTFLAARRGQLFPALGLVTLAVILQTASALARPAAAGPLFPLTTESQRLLAGVGATALCFGAVLLLVRSRLPALERPLPWRTRLRGGLRAAAGSLSPRALLFGPVFQKEVRVGGRRRLTYLARAAYPLVLLGVTTLAYIGISSELGEYRGAARLEQLQQLAPQLAITIGWCQFVVLLFIAPLLTAPAVCDERRAMTMPALMTTPLTSGQIIFGKLASRVVQLVILTLVAAPLLLAIRIFGGLDAEIIVATTSITLSAAILAAALGLMYSVWHRRAVTAAIFAMLSMGVFVLIVVVIFVVTALRSNLPPTSGWVFGLSAPMSMFAITFALFNPWPGADDPAFLTSVWVSNTITNLVLAAMVCAFATAALRRAMRAELAGTLTEREVRRAAPKGSKAGSRAGAARPVGDRPVLWREIRQSTLGTRRRLIILMLVVAIGLGWLYLRLGLHDFVTHGAVTVIGMLVLIVQAALSATSSVAAERESRTWDVLMTTPLRAGQILGGKFLGALRRQWLAPAWMFGHFTVAALDHAVHPVFLLHLAIAAAAVILLLTGTGLLFGSLLRRSTAAAVCNIALALGLWAVGPMGLVFTGEMMPPLRDMLEGVWDAVAAINPVAMPMIALNASAGQNATSWARHLTYDMPNAQVPFSSFTIYVAAAGAAGALIGIAALLAAIRLFPRISGRSS